MSILCGNVRKFCHFSRFLQTFRSKTLLKPQAMPSSNLAAFREEFHKAKHGKICLFCILQSTKYLTIIYHYVGKLKWPFSLISSFIYSRGINRSWSQCRIWSSYISRSRGILERISSTRFSISRSLSTGSFGKHWFCATKSTMLIIAKHFFRLFGNFIIIDEK